MIEPECSVYQASWNRVLILQLTKEGLIMKWHRKCSGKKTAYHLASVMATLPVSYVARTVAEVGGTISIISHGYYLTRF